MAEQKIVKTYRLEPNVVAMVQELSERLGLAQTRIIEDAVAHLYHFHDESLDPASQLEIMSQRLRGIAKSVQP